jgi:argonaute-like protein implicated in RNA metabolism and viral defense
VWEKRRLAFLPLCASRVAVTANFWDAMCPLVIDKETKKKLKSIRKELKKLKKRYNKMEFKPCKCDAELREKDRELELLRAMINDLEREQDRCILNSSLKNRDS